MLKKRVIPTLLWKNHGLVKGVGFDSWRRVGTILPAVKVYNTREVDELIVLDIAATREGQEPDYESVADFSSECFVPLTIGGGVRSVEHITKLLRAGADKVAINSAAFEDPELVSRAVQRYGSQCIVISIDVKRHDDGEYYCYTHSGQQNTGVRVLDWVRQMEEREAGEILITSVEKDGTMTGYDLTLIERVASTAKIPVIASGGAGSYEDFYLAIRAGASAAAAASIFHFTEQTPKEAKKYLKGRGVPVVNING